MARIIEAFAQFFDDAGAPLVDGYIKFTESGTNNTDKDTYVGVNEEIANANPVLLDGAGRCPNVFGSGSYRAVSYTSDMQQIQQFDPVGGSSASTGGQFGSWDADTIYESGVYVIDDEIVYRSLTANNQNNDPSSAPAAWEVIQFGRGWNAAITYSAGDSVYGSNGLLFYSLVGSNINNDPISDTANWQSADAPRHAISAGTADALTAVFNPVLTGLDNAQEVRVRALLANATATPTFAPDGLTAKTIVKNGNQALVAADIFGVDHELILRYNSTNDVWELLNPAAGGIALATPVATTSGTSIDFTSIPAGTKRIQMMFVGVSLDASTDLMIQLGDSGGVETTGYSGTCAYGTTTEAMASGLLCTNDSNSSANEMHGTISLSLENSSSNNWVARGNIAAGNTTRVYYMAGSKSLSAELDRVRLTSQTGSANFDLGEVNISYE